MSEEELDSIEILTNTDISTIELAENVDLITYSYAVKTVLNLIENLRIKNGKEFARGMETNEKLWRAKIKAMQDEYFEKVKHYDCDTADWKQSQYMGCYGVLGILLKGE